MTPIDRRRFITTLLALPAAIALELRAAENPPAVEATIFKFQFLPQEIRIKAGQSIRWTNTEKRQYHSVWFEQQGDPEPDYLFPGDSYQRRFNTPGSYPYRCGPHPRMTGLVVVE